MSFGCNADDKEKMEKPKETAKETKTKPGKGGDGRKRDERHKHKKKADRGSKKVENRSSQTSDLDLTKLPELAPLISSDPAQNLNSQDAETQKNEDDAKPQSKPSSDSTKGSESTPKGSDSTAKGSDSTTADQGNGFKSRSIFDYKPSPVRNVAASDPDLCKASTSKPSEVSKGLRSSEEERQKTQASKRASDASLHSVVTSGASGRRRQDTSQPSTSRDDTGNEGRPGVCRLAKKCINEHPRLKLLKNRIEVV